MNLRRFLKLYTHDQFNSLMKINVLKQAVENRNYEQALTIAGELLK